MFKITPIQDKEQQREICSLCGAEYRENAFAYVMYDAESGEIMGMSQFEIGKVGYIYDIREAGGRDDFEAMFILARQTMNFIDLCGAHICHSSYDAADNRLLRAAGFAEKDDLLVCDMTGMFDDHCGGHKQ